MCTSQNKGNPPAKFVWDGTNTDLLLLQNVSRQQSFTNYTCRQTWGPYGVINSIVNYTFTVACKYILYFLWLFYFFSQMDNLCLMEVLTTEWSKYTMLMIIFCKVPYIEKKKIASIAWHHPPYSLTHVHTHQCAHRYALSHLRKISIYDINISRNNRFWF